MTDGAYFIDRDPLVFSFVLKYLRGQPFKLTDLSSLERRALKDDARFYNLPGLVSWLEERELKDPRFVLGPNCGVSNDGKRVTKCGGGAAWNATAIADKEVTKGKHKWGITIVSTAHSHIMIGVCKNNIDRSAVYNYSINGWYFYADGSSLFSGPPTSKSGANYGSTGTLGPGAIVEVILDMENKTIGYSVNGTSLGIAYRDIPTDIPLRLCVLMNEVGDAVEITSTKRS
jgi:hypothetical protein